MYIVWEMSGVPSGDVIMFIGKDSLTCPSTEDDYRQAYDKRVREVCRADAGKTGFRVSDRDMDRDPLGCREALINFRAAFQVASQLSVTTQRQFNLSIESGRHPPSIPYEERLVSAFATVGVTRERVIQMINEAKIKVTLIPRFTMV